MIDSINDPYLLIIIDRSVTLMVSEELAIRVSIIVLIMSHKSARVKFSDWIELIVSTRASGAVA